MNNKTRRSFLQATADFYRCPNSGKVIAGLKYNDKVTCDCGKSNPKINESAKGIHVKSFLEPATVDDYLAQEERKHK